MIGKDDTMAMGKLAIGLAMFSLAFAFLVQVPGAQSVGAVNDLLSISGLKVSPTPVIAGSNVTISFLLFNSYTDSLSNINIALEANNQIINVSPTGSYVINSMGTGLYGGLGRNVFTYRFHVPSTLESGLYTIDVVASYVASVGGTNEAGSSTMPITMYIYGSPRISFDVIPESPLVPGSTFDFELLTKNTGTDTASNVSVDLLSSNDFTLSGQSSFDLGSIGPGSSSTSYASAIVAGNISSGTYGIGVHVRYSTDSGNSSYLSVIPVNIATGKPSIALSIAGAAPQLLYSGSNQTLSVLVQNIGTGTAKNLSFSFSSGGNVDVQSSASTFFVGSLAPGASTTVSVVVSAVSSNGTASYLTAGGSYYTSNYGSEERLDSVIPISVSPSAVFEIESVNDSLYPGGAYLPITLRIRNIGNQAARDVSFSLQSIYPITPVAGNAYVSYLAPGNETNVTFYANVDHNGLQGQYLLTVYEQWRQSNSGVNQQFSGSNNYYATVYSSPPSEGSDVTVYAAVAAVIVIALLLAIRVRKRKQKSKKKQ